MFISQGWVIYYRSLNWMFWFPSLFVLHLWCKAENVWVLFFFFFFSCLFDSRLFLFFYKFFVWKCPWIVYEWSIPLSLNNNLHAGIPRHPGCPARGIPGPFGSTSGTIALPQGDFFFCLNSLFLFLFYFLSFCRSLLFLFFFFLLFWIVSWTLTHSHSHTLYIDRYIYIHAALSLFSPSFKQIQAFNSLTASTCLHRFGALSILACLPSDLFWLCFFTYFVSLYRYHFFALR